MSADTAHPADGVLFVDGERTARWYSEHVAAVAPVELDLGDGCVVEIDPADPDVVLAWRASSDAAVTALARAVDDPAIAEIVGSARAAGTGERVVRAPMLINAWARFALVAAATRWTMRPVHKGALLIDRAVAAATVGQDAAAKTLFIYAEDALLELGQQCVDGELPAAVTDLVAQAVQVANRLGVAGDAAGLADELDSRTAIDDDILREFLTRRRRAAATASTDLQSGTLDGEEAVLTMGSDVVDIQAVPPRIIAWHGAEQPELVIEHLSDSAVFVITTTLADGVDPSCREVRRLLAYAAERDTGTLVATAPLRPLGPVLTAKLPAGQWVIADLHFGVLDAGTDLEALRTDPIGRCLAAVDRTMVEAWGHQRAANATLHTVPATADAELLDKAQAEHRAQLRTARSSAANARKRIERELRVLDPADQDTDALRALLRDRLDAVNRYPQAMASAADPILTELIPPEQDE
ncbi:hypothetical protein ACQPW1_24640 [Nocardia sp. CA-128927]|uniref:hypothetical protein n=1 Tax=Nocardia sp. CA-128927 TaxID=3239975 RepID=UPI003D9963B6